MAEMEEDKFVGEVWRQRLGLGYELVEGGGGLERAVDILLPDGDIIWPKI